MKFKSVKSERLWKIMKKKKLFQDFQTNDYSSSLLEHILRNEINKSTLLQARAQGKRGTPF